MEMRCAPGWSVAKARSTARASISPWSWPAFLDGSPEAEAFGSGFDDVRPVGDAIQKRLAEPGVGYHLSPFGKGQVRGQDDGGLLGSLGDDLEQELRAQFRHRCWFYAILPGVLELTCQSKHR